MGLFLSNKSAVVHPAHMPTALAAKSIKSNVREAINDWLNSSHSTNKDVNKMPLYIWYLPKVNV